jgi:hypothetical protein
VNFAFSKFKSDKLSDTTMALQTVEKAMAELGQVSRHAIDAVMRMSEQQRAPMRQLVYPVGLSCETMMVGSEANGAIAIDSATRAAIDAPEELEVQPSTRHEILISEMDRVNQSCKFAFRGDENDRRVSGEITDPIIQRPGDPYSAAFSEQKWVTVIGKLQLRKGVADKLFIADIAGE